MKNYTLLIMALVAGIGLSGCGSSNSSSSDGIPRGAEIPTTYSFDSRFNQGASSVAYAGQIARHALIAGLKSEIGGISSNPLITSSTTKEDVVAIFDAYYTEGTASLADNSVSISTDPGTLQNNYGSVSTNKNLVGKIAGNDSVTDHKDWDGGDFVGWTADSPNALIQEWFEIIANNTVAMANGSTRTDPVGNSFPLQPYHTDDGLDLNELVQKFLLGAVAFSQGTDDYLDDATDSKGLLTDNSVADGSAAYSALEHQFDEGFGYFGAARNYNEYTDDELAGKSGRAEFASGYHDTNGDGAIDLLAEFNFGHSTNAAKRDRGSSTATDFTKSIFDALLAGRAIIAAASGALSDVQMTALKEQRDIIVSNWEKAIAATVVHYINDVLDDMSKFNTSEYSYVNHAKHWSELKGFALGLQFNPRSPLNSDSIDPAKTLFQVFHELIGERPQLPSEAASDIENYAASLLQARQLLQNAYEFDASDAEGW